MQKQVLIGSPSYRSIGESYLKMTDAIERTKIFNQQLKQKQRNLRRRINKANKICE